MSKAFFLALVLFVCCVPSLAAETPEEGVRRLEEAWKVNPSGELVDPEFLRISKEIAAQHGVAIIAPIMRRSRDWRNDEGMLYLGIVLSLPKEKAKAAFQDYLRSQNEYERLYAGEFLTEIKMNEEAEAESKR